MVSKDEFTLWFDDYSARWPSVGDYVERHRDERLLDTWQQTLGAFDSATLDAVTAGIIAGTLEPVDNFKLGTFGDEIRRRCRQLLDERRRESDRWSADCTPKFKPNANANLVEQMSYTVAAAELVGDVKAMSVFMAAAVLSDKHTYDEEQQALQALQDAGIAWDAVCERAEQIRTSGFKILKSVEDM